MTMPPPPPPAQPYPVAPPLRPEDEKLWATLTHLSGIFLSFVGALVVYLVLRDRGPFIRAHSAAALNFQLTVLIAAFVCIPLSFIGIGFLVAGLFQVEGAGRGSDLVWFILSLLRIGGEAQGGLDRDGPGRGKIVRSLPAAHRR